MRLFNVQKLLENWRKLFENKEEKSKKLFAFDFDNTLVRTDGQVLHKSSDLRLNPEQWERLKLLNPDISEDDFDFSEFKTVVNPKPIKKTLNLMIKTIKKLSGDDKIVILTAREVWRPIKSYLQEEFDVDIEIVAVNSPKYSHLDGKGPERKASWVKKQLSEGFSNVFFWDDMIENLHAVKSLEIEHPEVSIKAFLVKNGAERCFDKLEEIEKFQQMVKNKHSRMKKRLIRHGNQPNVPPYSKKPSLERSKSAPPIGE